MTAPDALRPTAAAALAAWAARVRANREQVDRLREVPDAADFYAPTSDRFRADPRRRNEVVLERLRELVHEGETWLDIGAGAGRYALPMALVASEVIAVDPSPAMLAALREGMEEHGIANVRVIEGRWPLPADGPGQVPVVAGRSLRADVALAAHVGYDIEEIGPFLEAMEAATRRLCVAVVAEEAPSSASDALWPAVHGEPRAALPALAEFEALLIARDRPFEVRLTERRPSTFESADAALAFARRQLWVAEGSDAERRLRDVLAERLVMRDGRLSLEPGPRRAGIVTWVPDGGPARA